MATARQLNNLAATVDITIPSDGIIPDSQGFLLVDDDTNIEWTNNMTGDVQIVFKIGAINTIPVSGNGGTSGTISESEVAVNYQLEDANSNFISGPYSVQWGNGVLPITVSADSLPFIVAVPAYASLAMTGKIQFTTLDTPYTVKWFNSAGQPVNPWTPVVSTINPTPPGGMNPNSVQEAVPGAPTPVTCEFGPSPVGVPGNGTVRIGSSN
jgi:hypothetical protein